MDARLPADAGLWKDVWARRVLGRRERERFDGLRWPERRQLEWLGARTAAKEALARPAARRTTALDLRPADVEILPDDAGAPRVAIAGLDDLPTVPVVSLAHAAGQAAALAALVPRGSGACGRHRPRGAGRAPRRLRRGRAARPTSAPGRAGRAERGRRVAAALLVRQGGGRQGGGNRRHRRRRRPGRVRRSTRPQGRSSWTPEGGG